MGYFIENKVPIESINSVLLKELLNSLAQISQIRKKRFLN